MQLFAYWLFIQFSEYEASGKTDKITSSNWREILGYKLGGKWVLPGLFSIGGIINLFQKKDK
jgi:hypothetical protein